MAKIDFVCALHGMLESYFSTVDLKAKNDLSAQQHSVQIRKKVHISCAVAETFTALCNTQLLQPETFSKFLAQGICTYIA